jgi:CubicO group peptidase (beta-lactamase class C family)
MRSYLLRGAAALVGCVFLLTLTAWAEPPKDKGAGGGGLPATGKADPDLAPFDRVLTQILRENDVPGVAAAVGRDGKIVYARGFGYSDLEKKEPVEPDALFRIASISKPITAVAVLQLVERGKLGLDDKVFDVLGLKAPEGRKVRFDERWKNVTILELLQHRGGWDRDKSFDPMFRSSIIVKELKIEPPADANAVIRYMLRHPLDFDPGERYVYSNFGYTLLGRVIEKISGSKYEDYVKKEVLAPLGIERMRQGKTLLEDRAPGEVRYYGSGEGDAVMGPNLGKPVPWCYGGWCLESMDSHGAWISSAEDLVRFGAAFNDPEKCKILKVESIKTMFARPPGAAGEDAEGKPKAAYYGCGWSVRPVHDGKLNTWHTGSLDGTSTLLVRRWDNLTWAVLFNSREENMGHQPSDVADALMHEAAAAVQHWPGE